MPQPSVEEDSASTFDAENLDLSQKNEASDDSVVSDPVLEKQDCDDILVEHQTEDIESQQNSLELMKVDFSQQTSILNALQEKIDDLKAMFEQRLTYDEHKDTVNDRQYKELEAFRAGLLEKLQMSIFMDIIAEIDDAVKLEKYYENTEFTEENYHKLLKLFMDFSSNLCDLLEKHDVERFQAMPGEMFNPKTQTAQKKLITNDPNLQRVISQSLRYGFKLRDKIIRREIVEVYVYKKDEQPVFVEESVKEPESPQTTGNTPEE